MSASVGIIYAIVEKAVEGLNEAVQKAKHRKCIVKDCQNHANQGGFTGDLCNPCYDFISKGTGVYSQAYRNARREWVGLTDADKTELLQNNFGSMLHSNAERDFALIEAKLKEKNSE